MIYESKHFIFLNHKLNGWMLRYVMYHEIAHYLFHFPSQSRFGSVEFFSTHAKKKNHSEAEATAALLLLPVLRIPERTPGRRLCGLRRSQRVDGFSDYK